MASWDFADRCVVITGVTGGIATAISKAVASTQATIFLHARDRIEAATLAACLEESGARVQIVIGDLLTEADLVADEFARIGEIDTLFNTVGVYSTGDFLDTSIDTYRSDLEVNATASIATMQAVLPGMNERGFGRIVNISSGGGSFGEGLAPDHAAYAVSKAALNAATVMAASAAKGDVKVNAMCPGWVRTRMGGSAATRSPEEGADTALWLASLDSNGPNGCFFRDRKEIPW